VNFLCSTATSWLRLVPRWRCPSPSELQSNPSHLHIRNLQYRHYTCASWHTHGHRTNCLGRKLPRLSAHKLALIPHTSCTQNALTFSALSTTIVKLTCQRSSQSICAPRTELAWLIRLNPINLINQSGNFELDWLLFYDMLDWIGVQYELSQLDWSDWSRLIVDESAVNHENHQQPVCYPRQELHNPFQVRELHRLDQGIANIYDYADYLNEDARLVAKQKALTLLTNQQTWTPRLPYERLFQTTGRFFLPSKPFGYKTGKTATRLSLGPRPTPCGCWALDMNRTQESFVTSVRHEVLVQKC